MREVEESPTRDEQAGGTVTDTDMQPLRYNTKDSLLNPFFLVFGESSRDWSEYL